MFNDMTTEQLREESQRLLNELTTITDPVWESMINAELTEISLILSNRMS